VNKIVISLALALAFAHNGAFANEYSGQLAKLRATLRYVRALPPGTKTALRCPSNLERLEGVSIISVVAALGDADRFVEQEYSYYLASRPPEGQRPAGHPVITFHLGKSRKVDRVSCAYAK
jgi:hypothetical protein